MMKPLLALSATLCLASCAASEPSFTDTLSALCGETYLGEVVSQDPQDADWRAETLTLGPIGCEGDVISMPLAVGDDTSRTWMLEPTDDGLHFYHIHAHSDGSEDAVSRYGGYGQDMSATSAKFPADAFTKELFVKEGLEVSVPNIWSFEIKPGEQLAYELNRPGRFFRAEFELR